MPSACRPPQARRRRRGRSHGAPNPEIVGEHVLEHGARLVGPFSRREGHLAEWYAARLWDLEDEDEVKAGRPSGGRKS